MTKKETGTQEESNHHTGKRTGYELIDGVYHTAPIYHNQFMEITHRRDALDEMLNMVTAHVAKDLEDIRKTSHKIWEDIADDIGLDKSKNWLYHMDGTVREKKKEAAT